MLPACYSSPMTSLVLTDSSQLTSDSQHLVSAINVHQSAHPAPAPVISSFRKWCKLTNKQEDVDVETRKKKEAEENAIKITQDSRPKPIPLPSPSTDITPSKIKVVSRRKAPPRRSKRLKYSNLATPKEFNPRGKGQRVVEVEEKTVELSNVHVSNSREKESDTNQCYSSPVASLVLTDSSQLTALKSYQTKCIPTPNHLIRKNMCLAAVTSDGQNLGVYLNVDCQKSAGTYFQVGDIVSMVGQDNRIYYAQLRGFLTDQYCDKSTVITWIVPTHASPPPTWGFDPDTYVFG
uniref:(California timema) hypothetical protein n=1 Tax=Timema californicum TaxID=61474 RepID=A0A7R9JA64_TIMCA|nr:unnamed protein product [Timema californicum]